MTGRHGAIPSSLTLAAGESIRRNAGDTAFEAYTPAGGGTLTISNKTADYTITSSETGTVFTNTGAAGAVTFTLPTATAGLTYTFISSVVSQEIRVIANTGDFISLNSVSVTSPYYIYKTGTEASITLTAKDDSSWRVTSIHLSWNNTSAAP